MLKAVKELSLADIPSYKGRAFDCLLESLKSRKVVERNTSGTAREQVGAVAFETVVKL
jgi:hypothetical protein